MNKDRKSRLLSVNETLDEAIDLITEIIDEEQEAHDNLPENLQYSSRADEMEQWITDMEDIVSDIENTKSNIEALVE